MDACLDLLVPHIHVPVGVEDVTSRWAGEEEVVPRIFRSRGIEFRGYRLRDARYAPVRRLPPGYTSDDWWIITAAWALDALEHASGERGDPGELERIAAVLLAFLEPVSAWVLVFQPGCEQLDDVIAETREEAVARLLASIHSPSRGFMSFEG